MSTTIETQSSFGIRVRDVTGQKSYVAPAVPADASVGQMVQALLKKMGLGQSTDGAGRPVSFRARLARQSRFLGSSERVGDCLRPEDELTLTPDIQAG